MKVCKMFRFDAAHYLPNYEGKCSRLHGHGWVLEVEVEGPVHEDGMVVDFAALKVAVNHNIIDLLDHRCLNDLAKEPEFLGTAFDNPTCENLLDWMWQRIEGVFDGCELSRLRLYETPDSFAEMTHDSSKVA